MTKFSERDPFDLKEGFEKDRIIYNSVAGAAMLGIFVGVRLISTADIHDWIGLFRAGAGGLLCLGAVVGFWTYWNRP